MEKVENFWARLSLALGTESVQEMASRLGKTEQGVYNWRKGKGLPDTKTLIEIHQRTGISLHWLLIGEGPMRFSGSISDSTSVEPDGFESAVTKIVHRELAKTFGDLAAAQNLFLQAQVRIHNK